MMPGFEVVALVPMRHTSERVPGKNYRDFAGAPLFHHIIRTLTAVERVRTIVVDTDSDLVFEQCREYFPDVVLIDRPQHLTGGEVPMTEVLRHDAGVVAAHWYLQTHTTNPLLSAATIDAALDEFAAGLEDHDSLFGVTRLQTRIYDADARPVNHDPGVLLRTQDLPPLFEENSNIYVFSNALIESGRRIGDRPIMFEIDRLEALDIDEESDFVLAETIYKVGLGR